MINLFDRQIHVNEFKLRLLLTNGCNKKCEFCLNDFQPKPDGNPLYLDTGLALLAIASYSLLLETKYPLQVYFSGGEPTLHRDLPVLIKTARNNSCRVTLNTNGTFPNFLEQPLAAVNCLHFGVYEKSPALRERICRLRGSIQCVYSTRDPYVDFDFVNYYLQYGLPIKIFGDLREDTKPYEEFAMAVAKRFPDAPITFRFTGTQENRGIGCYNCDRYCVTLKGAWVFPDGGVSHCPQKYKGEVYYPGPHATAWVAALDAIQHAHKVGEIHAT